MNLLNPLTIPLDRHALIEASAGTGKTYTITTLYLRAILGLITTNDQPADDNHNHNDHEQRLFNIDEILVVTFTEAATQELRDRIRLRLKEAQHAILIWYDAIICGYGESDALSDIDPTILDVVKLAYERQYQCSLTENGETSSVPKQSILKVYHRIQNAITLIDESAVFTIHGFCQRVLNQFAFETQMAFEQTFEMDNSVYVSNALHDFWREYLVDLKGIEYKLVRGFWASPEKLKKNLDNLIDKPVVIDPVLSKEDYDLRIKTYQLGLNKLWTELQHSDFIEVLRASKLKKSLGKFIDMLAQFVSEPFGQLLLDQECVDKFTSTNLGSPAQYLKGATLISHPLSALFDTFLYEAQRLAHPEMKGYWINRAKTYVELGSKQQKQELQILTPDDLLAKLNEAVINDDGSTLLDAISAKYPLAFIDEFQDTDPVQYNIFKSIYMHESSGSAVIMIGDPKQAIYKFRGADINTYIMAKTQLGNEQHYTLSKNYRSHPDLIRAVNKVFAESQLQFEHELIPFVEVDAGKRDAPELVELQTSGAVQPLAKLAICHLTAYETSETQEKVKEGIAKTLGEAQLANQCAVSIQNVLQRSQQGNVCFKVAGDGQPSFVPLQAKDIAVLVRDRTQAKQVKTALASLGVRAVYLSNDSVYSSKLARDLLRVLEAINTPSDERKLRAAVASCFFGYSPMSLLSLQNNETDWHKMVSLFFDANTLWSRGQVTNALAIVMDAAGTLTKWATSVEDYERQITDVRHLSQLIEQQSAVVAGHEKLLVWLRATIAEAPQQDEVALKLESDSNLVQIVTMHGSKGLEYPIVYAPFVTGFKAAKEALYYSNKHEALTYSVGQEASYLQLADSERLSEDIRLLYVAMTRAKQHLWLGTFNRKDRVNSRSTDTERSAFGRLILADDGKNPSEEKWQTSLTTHLSSLVEEGIAVIDVVSSDDIELNYRNAAIQPYEDTFNDQPSLVVNEFSGQIDRSWSVLSFSALAENQANDHTRANGVPSSSHSSSNNTVNYVDDKTDINSYQWVPGLSDEQPLLDGRSESLTITETEPPGIPSETSYRFMFPKGSGPGSCLHYMFEYLDFQVPVDQQIEILQQACLKFGMTDIDLSLLAHWLQEVLQTSVSTSFGFDWQLQQLDGHHRLDEMEFYFDVKKLNSDIVGNALRLSGLTNGNYINALTSGSGVKGLLKGYIDLTCSVDGKYFVVDYKSNYLGDDFGCYSSSKMKQTMSDHNYYLQLLIYSYALHKWLQIRVPDYDYERHFGGAAYLFVRGMSPSSPHTGVFNHTVPLVALDYLDNALLKKLQENSGGRDDE